MPVRTPPSQSFASHPCPVDPVSLERQTCKSFVGRQRRAFSTAEAKAAAEKLKWKAALEEIAQPLEDLIKHDYTINAAQENFLNY